MNANHLGRVLVACATVCACVVASPGLDGEPLAAGDPVVEPIRVSLPRPGPHVELVGLLDTPIGEVVTIRGIVVDGPTKGDEGGPNIIVQSVNGVVTQRFVRLPVKPYFGNWGEDLNSPKGPPKLEVGATFEYYGFETGRFVGLPPEAYRRTGVLLQSTTHGFTSCFDVIAGSKIDPIEYVPGDFVDREALLEGIARNDGAVAVLDGTNWTIALDGPEWASTVVGKRAEAFGTVRKGDDGAFRLELGEKGRRGFVNLADMPLGEVTLHGLAFSFNAHSTLNYRGTTIRVHIARSPGESWPHGGAVRITGELEKLAQPDESESHRPIEYVIKRATWQRAEPLLIPEARQIESGLIRSQ